MVLAGVKAVTIHDTKSVELADLGAQFFLSDASIGKNKADACRAQLQELNTAVEVSASSAALTEEFLGKFQVRAVSSLTISASHVLLNRDCPSCWPSS